jgi:hypothetical protein
MPDNLLPKKTRQANLISKRAGGALIDSGPITATSRLEDVPANRWHNLMWERQRFAKGHLTHDCRCLVQFVADAERMYGPLGFKDADDFIARGLNLEPTEIRLAVSWLKINRPDEEIPLDVVRKLAKRGRPKKGEEKVYRVKFSGGNQRVYILARLERDGHTGLLAKIEGKEISAKEAARQAGYIKTLTPLERMAKLAPTLSDSQWETFKRNESQRRAKRP